MGDVGKVIKIRRNYVFNKVTICVEYNNSNFIGVAYYHELNESIKAILNISNLNPKELEMARILYG